MDEASFLTGFLVAFGVIGLVAAGFLVGVFALAGTLVVLVTEGFFAAGFFVAGFLAAAFVAAGFLAAGFLAVVLVAIGFLAVGFFAAVFVAVGFFAAVDLDFVAMHCLAYQKRRM